MRYLGVLWQLQSTFFLVLMEFVPKGHNMVMAFLKVKTIHFPKLAPLSPPREGWEGAGDKPQNPLEVAFFDSV